MSSKLVAAAIFVATIGLPFASDAAIQVYLTRAAFLSAVSSPGVDSFSDLTAGDELSTSLYRNAGTYSYVATSTSNFFSVGTAGEILLSTNDAIASMVFSDFGGGATAIGGNFFGSDINGGFSAGNVTLTALTASESVEWTIVDAVASSFVGFVSTESIFSLVLRAEQPPTLLWPTVDNLTLAGTEVSAVPEPGRFGLLVAGLAVLGLKRWRSI